MGPASAAAPSPPCADLLPPDRFSIFGVVHLLPLPGGPRPSPGLDRVRARALADVAAIAAGGAHGVIIENFGDAPFPAGRSAPHVVATMARLAHELRREPVLLGEARHPPPRGLDASYAGGVIPSL